jgi:hypothetical protein
MRTKVQIFIMFKSNNVHIEHLKASIKANRLYSPLQKFS